MGTRHLTSKFLTSTSLIISFALLVVFPYCASAIEPVFDVYYKGSVNDVYFQDGNSTTWRHSNGFYFYGNNADYTSNARLFTLSNSSHAVSIATGGYYVTVTGSFIAYSNIQDQFNASGTFGLSSQDTDCEVIDFDVNNVEAQNNSGTQQLTYKADWTLTCRVKSAITVGPTLPLTVNTVSNPGVSQVGILFNNFMWWVSDITGSQLRDAINQVNTTLGILNTMNTTINNLYSQGEDQLDALNDLRSAQEQANDDANARYQDEKDTINGSASDAESNASGQDFGFSIPNPLQSWFGGFSDNECVNIPNLAVWLHSNETQICTPWPSSVRTVVTTVVTGMFMLLLFGFIISWVKKNDTGGN